jgi:hypothetical protein
MYQYSGICGCGNAVVQFSSPNEINSYTSRKCDCDYCMQHGIEYLSDPYAQITFISKKPLSQEKQGSEQASFLLCVKCQTVVGVGYIDGYVSVGSLNAKLLDEFKNLQGSLTVSPKTLDKTEKVKRWRELWSQMMITVV